MFNHVKANLSKLISSALGLCSRRMHDSFWKPTVAYCEDVLTLSDIERYLESSGVKRGDTLFVHSSWQSFSNKDFTAVDLISFLIQYLGDDGTLAMPAFPSNQAELSEFNVNRTPSGAGLMTEVFRRYPGVKRSINLNHSVCALGRHAEFLVQEHHFSETSWDEKSPYFKLSEIRDAWIIGLGVGHRLKIATCLHCVESLLWKRSPYFKKVFKEQKCYEYIDANNQRGQHCYRVRHGQIYTPKVAKFFTENELIEEEIKGLQVYTINAHTLVSRAIELGKQGKTMYIWPIPFFWLFKSSKDNA